jgi:hypothetical protein
MLRFKTHTIFAAMKLNPDNLFTITEYARVLSEERGKKVFPNQVYRMIASGDLKTIQVRGVVLVVGQVLKSAS